MNVTEERCLQETIDKDFHLEHFKLQVVPFSFLNKFSFMSELK